MQFCCFVGVRDGELFRISNQKRHKYFLNFSSFSQIKENIRFSSRVNRHTGWKWNRMQNRCSKENRCSTRCQIICSKMYQRSTKYVNTGPKSLKTPKTEVKSAPKVMWNQSRKMEHVFIFFG